LPLRAKGLAQGPGIDIGLGLGNQLVGVGIREARIYPSRQFGTKSTPELAAQDLGITFLAALLLPFCVEQIHVLWVRPGTCAFLSQTIQSGGRLARRSNEDWDELEFVELLDARWRPPKYRPC
jgi:hypothetical protein